jgi:putative ABC transport system permease protein
MNAARTFLEAIDSLLSNKIRSLLTMLGIIIGVAAVIAMLGIGSGAQNSILGEIEGIGTNLLFVTPSRGDLTNPKPLTIDDAEALDDSFRAPSIAAVAPVVQGSAEVTFSDESLVSTLIGVTPSYFKVQDIPLTEGSIFNETQISGLSSSAILGANVAEELFGRTQGLVGETIRINGQPFRVLAVMKERGGSEFASADDQVLTPLTTAQVRLLPGDNRREVDVIYASAVSSEAVDAAMEEITLIMREQHDINLDQDDFSVLSQQSFLEVAGQITDVFTIFLGGVAGISLLVGGIGIMNIMLVTVTERTREIGLRKALGAKKLDILSQFLIESSLMSLVGGLLGIVFGWALTAVVGQIARANDLLLDPAITVNAVLLATLFSAAVGLFFGIYPANRAAQLEPIEALRTE